MTKTRSILMWIVIEAFFVESLIFQFMFGVYLPNIMKASSMSPSSLGALSGIFFIIYAICQFFSGFIFEKFNSKIVFIGSILVSALGVFVCASSSSAGGQYLSRILLGAGLSFTQIGVLYVCQKCFAKKTYPLLSSVSICLSNFVGGLFLLAGGYIIKNFSYGSFFTVISIIFVVNAVAVFLFYKKISTTEDNSTEPEVKSSILKDLITVFKSFQFWLATIFITGGLNTVITFGLLYSYQSRKDMYGTQMAFNVAMAAMVIFGVSFGNILSGLLSRKMNGFVKVARLFSLVALIVFLLLLTMSVHNRAHDVIIGGLYFILGTSLGGFVLGLQSLEENTDHRLVAVANSAAFTICFVFTGMIAQPLIGFIVKTLKNTDLSVNLIFKPIPGIHIGEDTMGVIYLAANSIIIVTLVLAFLSTFFMKSKKS